MEEYLSKLNPKQYEAVVSGTGQILVLAGPGSGKTRVLTQRIAYLMKGMGIRPYSILAVTFTNKAAKEMQERVESLMDMSIQGSVWLGTFHSVCARILRREADALPFNHNFVIMDADDQQTLVKRIIKELNLDEKIYRANVIHNAISNAKNNLQFPADISRSNYREETLFRVYEKYQEHLLSSNALDFDDLLLWTWRLLKDRPDIRERYSRRFEHVLVDEFQDTNAAQYQLLSLLSSYHKNIFVVGDEDQSIYRWRGADYRNILQFEKDFPKCQKILLEQNYRSTQNVLDAARGVIDHNLNRTRKNLFSDRGCGDKIFLYEAPDDRIEARYVAETISTLIDNGNAQGGDFAILYRTNSQSRLLEDAFLYLGKGYRLIGAQRFYGRREIKDIIAYLRLAFNPRDEISLARVINVPTRGIGAKSLQNLQMTAATSNQTAGDILIDLGKKGPESAYWSNMGRGALALADFGSRMNDWQEYLRNGGGIVNLIDKIIVEVNYRAYLDLDDDSEDRQDNIEELRKLAFDYEDRGLSDFLLNLALVSDQDTITENNNVPTLMTLHAVKGLEFNRIFIIGLDEGLLPHSRSVEDPEEMAEERRLFYVGLTRAKNHITLVRAEQRMSYGVPDTMVPSRFLMDIPKSLVVNVSGVVNKEIGKSSQSKSRRWENKPAWVKGGAQTSPDSHGKPTIEKVDSVLPPSPFLTTTLKSLDRVKHPLWAEGTVIESKMEKGEEVVTVQFKSVGLKQLIVSLAKLEKIS